MCSPQCRLCEQRPSIQASHVTPAFVFRAIKSDSVTGFMRRPAEPYSEFADPTRHIDNSFRVAHGLSIRDSVVCLHQSRLRRQIVLLRPLRRIWLEGGAIFNLGTVCGDSSSGGG